MLSFLCIPMLAMQGMHTTVKKFLNSLVPPFIDPAQVPEEVGTWLRIHAACANRCRWRRTGRTTSMPLGHAGSTCFSEVAYALSTCAGFTCEAQPQRVHLKAGDLLLRGDMLSMSHHHQFHSVSCPRFYLPIFWWHAVQGCWIEFNGTCMGSLDFEACDLLVLILLE